jgi:hypothetical protein
MKPIQTLTFFVLVFLALGLAPSKSYSEKSSDIIKTISQAENLRLEASKLGFEWTTTRVLLADAQKALKAGNKEKANQLAKRAINEAESAIKQAKFAQQYWNKSAL